MTSVTLFETHVDTNMPTVLSKYQQPASRYFTKRRVSSPTVQWDLLLPSSAFIRNSPNRPDWLWGPRNFLLNAYRGFLPWGKRPVREIVHFHQRGE